MKRRINGICYNGTLFIKPYCNKVYVDTVFFVKPYWGRVLKQNTTGTL